MNEARNLTRTDYLWITRSSARSLINEIEGGGTVEGWFKQLDEANEQSSHYTDQWDDAESIGMPLANMGIIGSGNASIAYSEAVQTKSPGEIGLKVVKTLTLAVASQVAFLNTFVKIAGIAVALASVKLFARGFVINLSDKDLNLVRTSPYFENCDEATGPLTKVLPAPRKIMNPFPGQKNELTDCVALQLLGVDNKIKLGGVDTVFFLDQEGGKRSVLAFGMPRVNTPEDKKKNPPDYYTEHSTLWPWDGDNGYQFLEAWKQGKLPGGPARPGRGVKKGPVGSTTMWDYRTGGVTKACFGAVFTGGK
ncbi:MAG: hypothetical protein ACRD3J_23010 [Thermoanaerobaculia bacterium]